MFIYASDSQTLKLLAEHDYTKIFDESFVEGAYVSDIKRFNFKGNKYISYLSSKDTDKLKIVTKKLSNNLNSFSTSEFILTDINTTKEYYIDVKSTGEHVYIMLKDKNAPSLGDYQVISYLYKSDNVNSWEKVRFNIDGQITDIQNLIDIDTYDNNIVATYFEGTSPIDVVKYLLFSNDNGISWKYISLPSSDLLVKAKLVNNKLYIVLNHFSKDTGRYSKVYSTDLNNNFNWVNIDSLNAITENHDNEPIKLTLDTARLIPEIVKLDNYIFTTATYMGHSSSSNKYVYACKILVSNNNGIDWHALPEQCNPENSYIYFNSGSQYYIFNAHNHKLFNKPYSLKIIRELWEQPNYVVTNMLDRELKLTKISNLKYSETDLENIINHLNFKNTASFSVNEVALLHNGLDNITSDGMMAFYKKEGNFKLGFFALN